METEKEAVSDVLPASGSESGKEIAAILSLGAMFLEWNDATLEYFSLTLHSAILLRGEIRRSLIIDLDDEWIGFRIAGKRVRVVWCDGAEQVRKEDLSKADLYYIVGMDEAHFGVISQHRLAKLPENRTYDYGHLVRFAPGDLFPANEFIKWAQEQKDPCQQRQE